MTKIAEPTIPQRLVDENEAAVRLGLKISTLRAWRCRGQGPKFYKIGGRAVRYAIEDLATYIGEPVANTSALGM
jgi:predicted DNA-binding transcriptional regulator AlpA